MKKLLLTALIVIFAGTFPPVQARPNGTFPPVKTVNHETFPPIIKQETFPPLYK